MKLKSHQKSEGALSELSESDVQKEVELLKEQYEFLQALITLLPSPMAIVDENGFVRFLNQSASKFFDKAVAGANFAQMLKEKFEEDNFGFNLHGMSEEKSSRPRIRGRISCFREESCRRSKEHDAVFTYFRRSKSPTGIRNKTRLKKAGTFPAHLSPRG